MRQIVGPSPSARVCAAIVALAAFGGLGLQFLISLQTDGSAAAAIWGMLRYFTMISNFLALLLFAAIALGVRRAFDPQLLAGAALVLALVGIVYVTLLRESLVGVRWYANALLHYAVPLLIIAYWAVFAPKGYLRWGDPPRWAAVPLAYFVYAILRASFDGRYAYPFIDVATLGWTQVVLNVAGIAACFLLAGLALVGLDRRLSSR